MRDLGVPLLVRGVWVGVELGGVAPGWARNVLIEVCRQLCVGGGLLRF